MSIESRVEEIIENNIVAVFSKSYCPFCHSVKHLFNELGVKSFNIELDEENKGSAMQDYLQSKTGQRTVPNVFINKKHIGGCSETKTAHSKGQLTKLLKEAGAM
eukprot:gb/GECH01012649.1/.p1 GENE.gb/GECH01012649.1/~~gb/GECH01012649.1/.p1  ORF type:complete len:104 (+),score=28.57 gb/GECH01012649.1/:1-312(+)